MKRLPLSLWAALAYAIAACIVTFPAIMTLTTHLIGHPFGDSLEYAAHIAWIARALHQGVNPFFQSSLLYPDGLSAAWLWAVPLQSFPAVLMVYIAPGTLTLAFNLSILAALTLNGWSMFLCVRTLLGNVPQRTLAAFTAGLIYLTYPAFGGHIAAGHIGLISLWGAPLMVHFMARLRFGSGEIWKAACCFAVSALGSPPLLLYLTLPAAGVMLWKSSRDRTAQLQKYILWGVPNTGLNRQAAALLLGAVLLLPFFVPYLLDRTASVTPASGAVQYSASALAVVSPSPLNPLYRGLEYPGQVIGGEPFENTGYIGLIGLIFSAIGLITARRSRGWAIMAIGAWVLSLGVFLRVFDSPVVLSLDGHATRIVLPFAVLRDLPIFNLSRTPARFNFAIGFAVAVMTGYGAAWLLPRLKRAALPVMLIMCAAVLADTRVFWEMPVISAAIPEAITALRETQTRAVFDVPYDHPLVDKEALYLQSAHTLPLIAGHIARETPLDPAKGTLLQETLDPALLDAAGVDVVILHREWDDAAGDLERRLNARFGAPTYQDERFAVFIVPAYTGDPPAALFHVSEIENGGARVSVFVAQARHAVITGTVHAGSAEGAALLLNGTRVLEWSITGDHGLDVPVDLPAGYSTIVIAPDPPCDAPIAPLVCRQLNLEGITVEFAP